MNRRELLDAGVAAGAGATIVGARRAKAAAGRSKANDLNVAIIGCGPQGRELVATALHRNGQGFGARFRAVCDIWDYHRERTVHLLKTRGQAANAYEDYRDMLAGEKDLDAVIIATPDFVHAEQAGACLAAGLHVYCEQPMAHTVAAARSMVRTMRKTGKLLQIGHQRRSSPRYLYALEKIVKPGYMLGPITAAGAQWRPGIVGALGMLKGHVIDTDTLMRYGYRSAREFRNWWWYSRYSAGMFARVATRQLDVLNWFTGALPRSVVATGGIDRNDGRQWPDNVIAIYEYDTPRGPFRAFYVMPGNTPTGSHREQLMGPMGTLTLTEEPRGTFYHWPIDDHKAGWERYVYEGTILDPLEHKPRPKSRSAVIDVRIRNGSMTIPCPFAAEFSSPPFQGHLANFFDAVGGRGKLNCPADVAFRSELPVYKTNDAIEAGQKLDLTEDDYRL